MENSEYETEFGEHLKTPEAALAYVKGLRNLANGAQRKFREFLWAVERRGQEWWLGSPTFATYITTHSMISVSVYEDWKTGSGKIPATIADEVGVHAVRHASRVAPEKLPKYIRETRATVKSTGGVTLSDRRAKQIADSYADKVEKPPQELNAEQLKRECDRLVRKVATLEKREVAYKAALAKKDEEIARLKADKPSTRGRRRERRGDAHPPMQ